MGKRAPKVNTRRTLDDLDSVQAAATDMQWEIGRARALGTIAPTLEEVSELLSAVMDLPGHPLECDTCEGAGKAVGLFADLALAEDFEPARAALIKALDTAGGEGANAGSEDSVLSFLSAALRVRAIEWVAERAVDMGQPELAEMVMKLEVL